MLILACQQTLLWNCNIINKRPLLIIASLFRSYSGLCRFFQVYCWFSVVKILRLAASRRGSTFVYGTRKPHLLSGCHLLLRGLRFRFGLCLWQCWVCREVRWGIQIQFRCFCRSMTAIQSWSQVMNTWADVPCKAYRWHRTTKVKPMLGLVV